VSREAQYSQAMVDPHKLAEVTVRDDEFMAYEATKPFGWEPYNWVRWATIAAAFDRLGIEPGAELLDVGCGVGWTTLFLAEAGYRALGVDLVPANVDLCRARAERWNSTAEFVQGDMESLELNRSFDAVLVYDALHHSARQADAVSSVANHLRPGGWVLFGEPSWLHDVSPGARRAMRDTGWRERGVRLRALRRDCRAAGLGSFRRFFQGTEPYERRGREFAWELARLVAANFAVAPRAAMWLAARRQA
jgi:SAM-dependent methyltransferase